MLWDKGSWDEAKQLQKKVLETRKVLLSEDHLDTLAAIHCLAPTLLYQGRWDKAKKLQKKVLETFKALLGEEHPNTLSAMSNLTTTDLLGI
jgi:dihydrodipicolinate synthase/N-acetylneuraminate lyase